MPYIPTAVLSPAAFGTPTTWTPALTASSSNPTLGVGSIVSGLYIQSGKFVQGSGSIIFGSSGAAAGSGTYQISVPVNIDTRAYMLGQGWIYDSSGNVLRLTTLEISTGGTIMGLRYDNDAAGNVTDASPWVWSNNDVIRFGFSYIAA